MVLLVGVQTNQFPRAMDIARPLRAAGVPVCIGGFHVSGCIAMLGPDAPELALARELGVSMFAGEAEEGGSTKSCATACGKLKPLYNHLAIMPSLQGAPAPILARADRPLDAQLVELRSRTRLSLRVFVLHHHQRAGPQEPLPHTPTIWSASCAKITPTA